MPNNKNVFKKLTVSAAASAALLCSSALISSQANAETITVKKGDTTWDLVQTYNKNHDDKTSVNKVVIDNNLKYGGSLIFPNQKLDITGNKESMEAKYTSRINGILTTVSQGNKKIRLLDRNGNYQDQYVSANAKYLVWEQGVIRGEVMYRIGTQKQWIPAKYTNWNKSVQDLLAEYTTKGSTTGSSSNANVVPHVNIKTPVVSQSANNQNPINQKNNNGQASQQPNNGGQTTNGQSSQQPNNGGQTTNSQSSQQPNNGGQTNNGQSGQQPNNGGQTNNGQSSQQPNNGGQTNNGQSSQQPNNGGQTNNGQSSQQPNNGGQVNNGQSSQQPNNGGQTNNGQSGQQPNNGGQTNNGQSSQQPNNGGQTNNGQSGQQPNNGGQTNNGQSGQQPNNGGQTNNGQSSQQPNNGGQTNNGVWNATQLQEAQTAFINYVNKWRATQNLLPFANNMAWLQKGAETRADDNVIVFKERGQLSHTRPDGSNWQTAFDVQNGGLGGENLGYSKASSGKTPQEIAENIASEMIAEGPNGGHYAVLALGYGKHPEIGVAFRSFEKDGMYVYILNMETGTSDRIANSAYEIDPAIFPWASKWAGKYAPDLTSYTHYENGKLIINANEMPTITNFDDSMNGITDDELPEYEEAFINYYQTKYGAEVIR